eukprot:GHVN01032577.1.p1 GENE.GHVN01032577.1~~GHVN01032577.1.p1  ORF type:complete len:767 (-),score=42.96 GHVN01032577.1:74-2374(-)
MEPIMTCYKVFVIDIQGFGWLRTQIEATIVNQMEAMLLKYHRKALCWLDFWHGMTLDDIRAYEDQVAKQLAQRFGAPAGADATSETGEDLNESSQEEESNLEGELASFTNELLKSVHPSEASTALPVDLPLETRTDDLISEVIHDAEKSAGLANITRSGNLLKLGEGMVRSQTWNNRYVVLHNSVLRYYSDARDKQPKEEIDVRGAQVCWASGDHKDRRHAFVVNPSGTKRQIHFSGENEEATKQWMIWCQLAAEGCKSSLALTEEELRNMQPSPPPKPSKKNIIMDVSATRQPHLISSPSQLHTSQANEGTSVDLPTIGASGGEGTRAADYHHTASGEVEVPTHAPHPLASALKAVARANGTSDVSACITELTKRSVKNYTLEMIHANFRVFLRRRRSPRLGVAPLLGTIFLMSTVPAFLQGVAVCLTSILELLSSGLGLIFPFNTPGLSCSEDSVMSMRAPSIFLSAAWFLLCRLVLPFTAGFVLLAPSLKSDERLAEEVLKYPAKNPHQDKVHRDRNLMTIVPFLAKTTCSVNCSPKEMFAVLMDHKLTSEWSIGHEASMVVDTVDAHNDYLFETFRPSLCMSWGSFGWLNPIKILLSCVKRRSLCRKRFWSEFPVNSSSYEDRSCGYIISLTSASDAGHRLCGESEGEKGNLSLKGKLRRANLDMVPATGVDYYIVSPVPDHPRRCILIHLTGLQLGGSVPWRLSQQIVLSRACMIEGLRQRAENTPSIGGLSWIADSSDAKHRKRVSGGGLDDVLSQEKLR